jgi:hypothetical protein
VSITACIPIPRLLTLAGEEYLVSEFRLRDLAELTAWAEERSPDPLGMLAGIDREAEPERWRAAFRGAWEAAEAGPPGFGSDPVGDAVRLVYVAIRRHRPGFGPDDAAELLTRMTGAELDGLTRIVWGADVLDEFDRILDPPTSKPPAGIPWEEAIDLLSRERGLGYEAIAEMSLSAFANALRGGKPKERGITPRPGESVVECARRRRRLFFGDGEES